MHPREFSWMFSLTQRKEIQINLAWIFRNCSTTKGANLFLITLELCVRGRGWERRQRSLETNIESTLRNMYPSANPKCLYNFNQFRIINSAWTRNSTQHVVCSSRFKSFTLVLLAVSIVFATTIQKQANDPIKF